MNASEEAITPACVAAPAVSANPVNHVPVYVTWVTVLIVVLVGKVAEWVPGLSSLPLAKIAFLVAAIAAFRKRAALAAVRVRSLKIARPAIAFMTLAILSVLFSIYKSNTLIASQAILINLMSMTLLLKVTHTHKDIERLLTGFVGAGVSLALGVLLNYHGGRADINSNFDPNEIAYALDTALPLALALRSQHAGLARLLFSVMTLFMVVSVLLTGSRGGAIGLCVVTAAVTMFPISRDASGRLKGFSFLRTLVRCGILIAAFVISWGYLPAATQERMASLLDLQSDYNADPNLNASRTVIWRRDVGLALERPIGYGLGSAEAVDGLHGGQYKTAHNSIVQALVELGILGMILYLYNYFSAWRELGRLCAAGQLPNVGGQVSTAALYARAIRVALAGNLVAGFFLSQAYCPALWMMLAIAAALVRIATPDLNRAISCREPAS